MDKLQREIKHYPLSDGQAEEIADFILATYDLAPHGLLMPLVDYIAEEAREYPYKRS